ncbi:MAG TPA: hypothetical protein VNO81_13795 [Candidatus Nitrosotenuis sp.]|nr:hypothetical protein [Candidatus Nitrosotenuis sp.]
MPLRPPEASLSLLELVAGAETRSLAVVGLGKNVGKTTFFNHLVGEARAAGRTLGLTSIGRDGEEWDAISYHRKPPIRVRPGMLVATARGCLPADVDSYQVLRPTPWRTPLGEVVLARSLRETDWVLAGPGSMKALQKAIDEMLARGADLVLVDGAFGRRASAAPAVAQAAVLVSGAALDSRLEVVVEETAQAAALLTLPPAELPGPARALVEGGRLGLWEADGVRQLEMTTALGAEGRLAGQVKDSTRAVLLGSSLTPRILAALEPRPGQPGLTVVVPDATRVLVPPEALRRFQARGGELRVARPIRLPLVVANPFSPYGWSFPAGEFLEALARRLAPLPVADVVAGRLLRYAAPQS